MSSILKKRTSKEHLYQFILYFELESPSKALIRCFFLNDVQRILFPLMSPIHKFKMEIIDILLIFIISSDNLYVRVNKVRDFLVEIYLYEIYFPHHYLCLLVHI